MRSILLVGAVFVSAPLTAQDVPASPEQPPVTAVEAQPAPLPIQARRVSAAQTVLPANTEITFETTQEVTTKGKTWSEGDTFNLSVVNDVRLGDYVVIPKGSRGVGRITWLTSKGAFGKSGKMDIEIEYVEVGGQRVDVTGTYRQEGEGNTVATIGGVVLAGVFAGFITGKSGRIPKGRELTATTDADLPVALPEGASAPVANAPIKAVRAAPVVAAPAPAVDAMEVVEPAIEAGSDAPE